MMWSSSILRQGITYKAQSRIGEEKLFAYSEVLRAASEEQTNSYMKSIKGSNKMANGDIRYIHIRKGLKETGKGWNQLKLFTNYELKTDPRIKMLPAGGITIAYNRARTAFGVAIHSMYDNENKAFCKAIGRTHAAARLRQGEKLHKESAGDADGFIAFPAGYGGDNYAPDYGGNMESFRDFWEPEYDCVISVLRDMGVETWALNFYNFSHGSNHRG